MAILGKGPGPKKKNKNVIPPSKVYRDPKSGQTMAAPGYKMGVIPKRGEASTKQITGPFGSKATVMNGIYGPIPVGPGKKVAAAAPKKKTAVGKVVKKVGRDIDYAASQVKNALTPSVQKRGTFKGNKGGGRGGKTCAAYR